MATIIYQHGSSTSPARRCDASCHKAKPGSKCRCVCGGRYHGVGSSEVAQEMLMRDAWERAQQRSGSKVPSFQDLAETHPPKNGPLVLAEWETL